MQCQKVDARDSEAHYGYTSFHKYLITIKYRQYKVVKLMSPQKGDFIKKKFSMHKYDVMAKRNKKYSKTSTLIALMLSV